jgi:adenylate cyclase
MLCIKCGAENSDANEYCQACGASFGLVCSACGRSNPQKSLFCGQCGTPLTGGIDKAYPPPDNLLRSLSATGGERKLVTLLFADIGNSTKLIDSLDAEGAMRRLRPVLDCMKAAVERYDGVVTGTRGDGIVVYFGAPKPHEDHAVRACLAALAMQDGVSRFLDPLLKIRVGIHTGEVIIHAVRNTLYETFDATGTAAHLASRMEQMAEEGGILLSRDTYAATRQFVKAESLGLKTVRGLSAPMEVFKLIGVRHARASELFRSRTQLTPLIGRDNAVQVLEEALASTINGEGQTVGVVGEAGIGKSRLCFEFAEHCRRRGIRVHEARVLAYGRATPLQPVLELLRDYFGIRMTDAADDARRRVVDSLRSVPGLEEALPVVLDFLGLVSPEYPLGKLDPGVRKIRLIDAVRRLTRSGRRDQPTVIIIEDLHWIDTASAEFVEALVDAVPDTTALLVLNFRPDFVAPWMQRSHYRQIGLGLLDPSTIDQLLRSLVGADPSLALICRNIAERARGNPFFLEELVHSLVERGDFKGDHGAYRVESGIGEIPLPSTVEAVLAARIDRLNERARNILQNASVIGREVPLSILERVSEKEYSALAETLFQLRRAELLYELPRQEEALYAFRHPLIQEVAYRSLLSDRRRALHGAVARAIEAQFKDRLGERAGLLAYHLEQAGEMLKAAQASLRAAMWVGATDSDEAFRRWKKVLELLAAEPMTDLTNQLRMMACGQVMSFGWRTGALSAEEAEPYFAEARALALASKSLRGNALITAAYGRILATSGSADNYVEKIREAEALANESDDASLQVTVKAMRAQALRLAGWTEEALKANSDAMDHAREIDKLDSKLLGFDIQRWLIVMRGQILVTLGRFAEARTYLDQLLQLDPRRGDLTDHLVDVTYVELAWGEDDAPLAEQHAARAFSIALKSGGSYARVYAQASRGLAHIAAGRLDAAIEDLSEAIAFARRRKAGLEIEARMLAELAHAHDRRGDRDDAERLASEALGIAMARCARVPQVLAHLVRASVLQRGGQDASVELDRAEALMAETAAAIYQPLLDDLRGRTDRDTKRRGAARAVS